jgi:hypothetical protein
VMKIKFMPKERIEYHHRVRDLMNKIIVQMLQFSAIFQFYRYALHIRTYEMVRIIFHSGNMRKLKFFLGFS